MMHTQGVEEAILHPLIFFEQAKTELLKPMNKIQCILILGALSASLASSAQTANEALRYSTFDVLGTARSIGVSGSMSPLGGDFSVLNVNPAGSATYRGSEFTMTPAFFNNRTTSTLENSGDPAISRTENALLLSNLGLVIASRPRDPKWKTSNFALGITKVADFNAQLEFRGSTPGSITDRYAELAFGTQAQSLTGEAALAYNTGAIYDFNGDLNYETDYRSGANVPVLKRQSLTSSGYNTELLFSYGANYNEKLLFGFGVGVPILSFEESKVYREDDQGDQILYFNSLRYDESLSTSGSGFNFKAGLIYKPVQSVNLSAAFHSRTRYSLTDNFTSSLEYDYTDSENDGPLFSASPQGSFNYNLRTPRMYSGGIGVVIARSGFVSAEVQYRDFGSARFKYTGRGNGNTFLSQQEEVNATISSRLDDALTLRMGGELAIKKWRVRGGAELDQSPFAGDKTFDTAFSTGVGFRGDKFFIDLAYQYVTRDVGLVPYVVEFYPSPLVVNEVRNNRIFLTLAYRWL